MDTARPSDPALESVTVCEEAFCLTGPALPPGPVAPAEVDRRAWVALRRGTRLRGVFDRLMADQHLVPVVAAEVGDIRLLARLSAAGFGNAALSTCLSAPERQRGPGRLSAATAAPRGLLPGRGCRPGRGEACAPPRPQRRLDLPLSLPSRDSSRAGA